MEETFKARGGYDKSGKAWSNTKGDMGYELEVSTRLGFDQRQVLQIRAAIKDCQRKIEAVIQERLSQVQVNDLPTEGYTPPQGDLEAHTKAHTSEGGLG